MRKTVAWFPGAWPSVLIPELGRSVLLRRGVSGSAPPPEEEISAAVQVMDYRNLAAALALLSMPAMAQELPCHQCPGTVWYVDASQTANPPNGSSWAKAYRKVQQALSAASAGDCIWVAAGDYFPTVSGNQAASFDVDKSLRIYGGFSGDELCFNARAGLFTDTCLSGEIGSPSTKADNSYTIVTIEGSFVGETPDVVIDGFCIEDANNTLGTAQGGGIRCASGSSLELRNCTIRRNEADFGAGLFASGCQVDIVKCKFAHNDARVDGGAIWAYSMASGVDPNTGGPNIYNTIFKNNEALQRGGAFFLDDITDQLPVLFMNCLFHDNSADEGGVGYLLGEATLGYDPGRARLVNCTLSENDAASLGAALVAEHSSGILSPAELEMTNCVVWGNTGATPPAIEPASSGSVWVDYTIVELGSSWDCNPVPDCANSTFPVCTVFDCDPLLTANFKLGSGSPGIDSGDKARRPLDVFDLDGDWDTTEFTPVDLGGRARVQGGEVDRGVYETSPP